VCDLETSRMGAPYIYDISRLRVKDLHSATYIYVVRRLRVKHTLLERMVKFQRNKTSCVLILHDTHVGFGKELISRYFYYLNY